MYCIYNKWVKSWTPQREWNHVFRKEWAFPAPDMAPVTIHSKINWKPVIHVCHSWWTNQSENLIIILPFSNVGGCGFAVVCMLNSRLQSVSQISPSCMDSWVAHDHNNSRPSDCSSGYTAESLIHHSNAVLTLKHAFFFFGLSYCVASFGLWLFSVIKMKQSNHVSN